MDPSTSEHAHQIPPTAADPSDIPRQQAADLDALAANDCKPPASHRGGPQPVGRAPRDAQPPFFDRSSRRMVMLLVGGALAALGLLIAVLHRPLGF
jgi:hypothetical protein